jgi:N-acetylmuramoyl-L-alanine amidase
MRIFNNLLGNTLLGTMLGAGLMLKSSIACGTQDTEDCASNKYVVTCMNKVEYRGKVVLDLPHLDTAQDPGAVYGNYKEEEISRSITLKVKRILEENGVEVIMSRGEYEPLSISERRKRVNGFGDFDYYISLHCNSCKTENTGTGVEGYSKNAWSLTDRILKGLCSEFNYTNRGIYATPFYNKNINNDNTLIEMGFINNKYDRDNLVNHQDRYAEVIADAIITQLDIDRVK